MFDCWLNKRSKRVSNKIRILDWFVKTFPLNCHIETWWSQCFLFWQFISQGLGFKWFRKRVFGSAWPLVGESVLILGARACMRFDRLATGRWLNLFGCCAPLAGRCPRDQAYLTAAPGRLVSARPSYKRQCDKKGNSWHIRYLRINLTVS